MGKASDGWTSRLTAIERLSLADAKIQQMLDLSIELVHLHEVNRLVAYDARLKSQVPLSFAGVSYRVFERVLIQRELVGVCTMWDPSARDRSSIPTVCDLLADRQTQRELRTTHIAGAKAGRSLSAQGNDPELLTWIERISDAEINEQADERSELLLQTLDDVREYEMSHLVRAARGLRDAKLAHNLAPDARKHPELRTQSGDEGKLLEVSIATLENLNLVARNSSYDWPGTWNIARRNAEALWSQCTFNVLE